MNSVTRLAFDHLAVELERSSSRLLYRFAGTLDERFNHTKVPVNLTGDIVMNLRQVRSINSSGVRAWVQFIRQFENLPSLTFEECSVAFVDQFNIVPPMLATARITSFYAPYYCPKCDEEAATLIECAQHAHTLLQKKAPDVVHACGSAMEFDALEASFFHLTDRFIRRER